MEANVNSMPDREDSGTQMNGNQNVELNKEAASLQDNSGDAIRLKHRHHDDHHVNRKYRIFSNHSSAGDTPHTNTSF